MRTAPLLLLLLTLLAASGCSLFDEPVCTQIGCDDGLLVEVEGAPAGAFTLDLIVGGEVVGTYACTGSVPCPLALFEGATPEEATLRLTWDGGAHEETFRPAYQVFRPNGPRCPPVCRQATVRLRLP